MKIYEKIEQVSSVHTGTVCAICRKKHSDDWDADYFEQLETTVEYRRGTVYPEGGSVEVKEIDVCPSCFEDKVIPAIEELGCEFSTREHDVVK